jgi:hypothetical protein
LNYSDGRHSSSPNIFVFGLIVGFGLLAGLLAFQPFFGVLFANRDDMDTALIDLGRGFWSLAKHWAVWHGRAQSLIGGFGVIVLPFQFGHGAELDAFQFGPWIAVGLLIGWMIARFTGSLTACAIFIALFFGLVPVGGRFNAFVSYPMMFAAPLLAFLISLLALHLFLKHRNRPSGLLAGSLIFFSFMAHETMFFGFIAVAGLFILTSTRPSPPAVRDHWVWLPLLVPVILHVVIYIAWRLAFGSQNAALALPTIGVDWLTGWAKALLFYVRVSIPAGMSDTDLRVIRTDAASETVISEAMPAGLDQVTGLSLSDDVPRLAVTCVLLALAVALPCRARISAARTLFFMGLIALVASQAVIAASSNYQTYVAGGYAPIHTAAFGYVSACVALVGAVTWVDAVLRRPWVWRAVVGIVVLVLATLHGSSMRAIAADLQANAARWRTVGLLSAAQVWRDLPGGSQVAAPGLFFSFTAYSVPTGATYWSQVIEKESRRSVPVVPSSTPASTAGLSFDCSRRDDCTALLRWQEINGCHAILVSRSGRYVSLSAGGVTFSIAAPNASVVATSAPPRTVLTWREIAGVSRADVSLPEAACSRAEAGVIWITGGRVNAEHPLARPHTFVRS